MVTVRRGVFNAIREDIKGLIAGYILSLVKGRVLKPWEGIVKVDSKFSFF